MASELKVDTISEKTTASGVTIDSVLLKDGLVDGVDVSSLVSAGLVYIDSGTFSSVSTATVSNVFSSTYQNYKILLEITDNSADNTELTFRLYDGSEITTNYISQKFQGEDSTAEIVKNPTGTDDWPLAPIDQTYTYGAFIQVLLNSPQQATATHFSSQGDGTYGTNTLYSSTNTGVHTGTDQATGFAVKVVSGTFDGNYAVYGFAES